MVPFQHLYLSKYKMSSQGPPTSFPDSTGTVQGYGFQKETLRDASDWTAFLRQSKIAQERASVFQGTPKDPWIPYGSNRRLDVLEGQFKLNAFSNCTGCTGPAFSGNGNYFVNQEPEGFIPELTSGPRMDPNASPL